MVVSRVLSRGITPVPDVTVAGLGGRSSRRRLQITASTVATSAAAAGRGSLRGTLMVSILSIGFARSRSWRTAQRQNEAAAARLRLRVDGARPVTSAR